MPKTATPLAQLISAELGTRCTVMAQESPAHTIRNPRDVLYSNGKRIYEFPRTNPAFKEWIKWTRSTKNSLSLIRVEGWQEAEKQLGIKLSRP
jgi:hypothetical protein